MDANERAAYEKAVARVEASEALNAHRDVLIDYDWQEGEEHYSWVASAPEADLIAWAESLASDAALDELEEQVQRKIEEAQ